jgi:hypothetical protein
MEGALWQAKGHLPEMKDMRVEARLHQQRLVIHHVGFDKRTVFTGNNVTVETENGRLLDFRENPRSSYAGQVFETPWDDIHNAYFTSYALWTYLTVPFVYTYPGFAVTELSLWRENGEVWRPLRVTFPKSIPSHTETQVRMLETGALDIGFLRVPIGEHSALDVVTVHREAFVLVVPSSHKLAKRKRVRLREVAGEDFVMYERTYAPGFHDLMFGILRDARIAPNVTQTAVKMPMLISLVASGMGITIMPASVAKHYVASVVACEILDRIPTVEIALAVSKRFRTPVVDNFRSFALKTLGHSRHAL